MITLTQYINQRLGETSREQSLNFLGKPFGAASLAEFWQYWNPVWNYYLYYYGYKPVRKYLPRWMCILWTFFLCGLLHDLPIALLSYTVAGRPPFFTLTAFLTLNGMLVVLTEKLGLRLAGVPVPGRWLIHAMVLLAGYQLALGITTRVATGSFSGS